MQNKKLLPPFDAVTHRTLVQLFALLKDICAAVANAEQIVSSYHSVSGDSGYKTISPVFDVAPLPAKQIPRTVKCCLSHVVFFLTITPSPTFFPSYFSCSANSPLSDRLETAGARRLHLRTVLLLRQCLFCNCVGLTDLAQL